MSPCFNFVSNRAVTGFESIDVYLERANKSVRTRILIALCCANACDAVETMSVGFMLNKLTNESDTTRTLLAASVEEKFPKENFRVNREMRDEIFNFVIGPVFGEISGEIGVEMQGKCWQNFDFRV